MVDQLYQFSKWIYSILEGFFGWAWNLLSSGRLDYLLKNWLAIALILSLCAFLVDMMLYYLNAGEETLTVNAILFLVEKIRRRADKAKPGENVGSVSAEALELDEDYEDYGDFENDEPVTLEAERAAYGGTPQEERVFTREDSPRGSYAPNNSYGAREEPELPFDIEEDSEETEVITVSEESAPQDPPEDEEIKEITFFDLLAENGDGENEQP